MSQLGFGFDRCPRAEERLVLAGGDELFLDADAHDLFVGAQWLEHYLSDNNLGWVVPLSAVLKDLDYSAFLHAYASTGRRALHPRVMLWGWWSTGFSRERLMTT